MQYLLSTYEELSPNNLPRLNLNGRRAGAVSGLHEHSGIVSAWCWGNALSQWKHPSSHHDGRVFGSTIFSISLGRCWGDISLLGGHTFVKVIKGFQYVTS